MRTLSIAFLLVAASGCNLGDLFGTEPKEITVTPEPFTISYGTPNFDSARHVIQLSDGDLLVVGTGNGVIAPADGTLPTPSLTRIAPDGSIVWSRVYEDLKYAAGLTVVESGNEFLMYVSRSDDREAYGGGLPEITCMVVRVSKSGELGSTVFRRDGVRNWGQVRNAMVQLRDGSIAVHYIEEDPDSAIQGPHNVIERLSESGSSQWIYRFPERGTTITDLVASGNDVLGVGHQWRDCRDRADCDSGQALGFSIDSDGALNWQNQYGSSTSVEQPSAIVELENGAYAFVGASITDVERRLYMVGINREGTEQWSHTMDVGNVRIAGANRLSASEILITGSVVQGDWDEDAWVQKVDIAGALGWSDTVGKTDRAESFNTAVDLGNGFVALAGHDGPAIPTYGGANYEATVSVIQIENP